jgi:hypothetical protein
MSIEAMAWVLNHAEVRDATEVLVLLGIANHADREGRGSRAGQATLARYARCSDRTVRRKLTDLEARGFITRGDQQMVAHIRRFLRPVVWDLVWGPAGQNVLLDRPDNMAGQGGQNDLVDSPEDPDRQDTALSGQAGHSSVRTGRTRMSTEPSEEPLEEPSDLKDLAMAKAKAGQTATATFEDFWAVYPRREKKIRARAAWDKITTGKDAVDPAVIIQGAGRYAEDPNRDPGFTAHPSSWLNDGRWEDDPLPPRPGRHDRQGDIMARELVAARAADAGRQITSGWD